MALVGVELETLVFVPDALTTRPPGWSEWRARKRPSIYRRSRAVIGREPMGVTAKLYAVSSQLSAIMQNF